MGNSVHHQLSRSIESKKLCGFAYEYTYPTMNTLTGLWTLNMNRATHLAFLLQVAHKIAFSCPKFIDCRQCQYADELNQPWTMDGDPTRQNDCFAGPIALKMRKLSLPRDFHSQPTHGHAAVLWVYHPPLPVPSFLLTYNQSLKVTCYSTYIYSS